MRLAVLAAAWPLILAQWNDGCLCDLKATPAASHSDLTMSSIFGTSFFRQNGKVAKFCPCSVETVQKLNSELIAPRLFPLLNRTFFRYAKVALENSCPFWDDSGGSCALRDWCEADREPYRAIPPLYFAAWFSLGFMFERSAVEECSEDEVRRLGSCDEGDATLGEVQRPSKAQLEIEAPSWDLGDGVGCALTETCKSSCALASHRRHPGLCQPN